MRRITVALVVAAALGVALGLWLTAPKHVTANDLVGLSPDELHGRDVFNAAGCASCHSAPGAEGENKLILAGGKAFASDFGTFYAPNISSGSEGIGGWTAAELTSALIHGSSPSGQHYYPALPYTSYARMTPQDAVDLRAYMATLPASDAASRPHDVGFPFNIRLSLGGWKMLFLDDDWIVPDAPERGRYLVEALGHCGECHSPRNALGAIDRSRWLGGAPNPTGKGRIPNITPGALKWSEEDIITYLTLGFTPDFDSVGGEMVDVVQNLEKLPEEDVRAIAAYLKAVPPVTSP